MNRVATAKLCAEIRAEAERIRSTRSELFLREVLSGFERIRAKIDASETREEATPIRLIEPVGFPNLPMDQPPVEMTREEQRQAHEVLQEHFAEDRNELRGASHVVIISLGTGAAQHQSDQRFADR